MFFAKDLFEWYEMVVPTMDGDLRMRPKAGLMGHVLAPKVIKVFIRHYTKYVAKWNATPCFEQPALLAKCPVTQQSTDLSIGCFVDDVQTLIVAGDGKHLSNLRLGQLLQAKVCKDV